MLFSVVVITMFHKSQMVKTYKYMQLDGTRSAVTVASEKLPISKASAVLIVCNEHLCCFRRGIIVNGIVLDSSLYITFFPVICVCRRTGFFDVRAVRCFGPRPSYVVAMLLRTMVIPVTSIMSCDLS